MYPALYPFCNDSIWVLIACPLYNPSSTDPYFSSCCTSTSTHHFRTARALSPSSRLIGINPNVDGLIPNPTFSTHHPPSPRPPNVNGIVFCSVAASAFSGGAVFVTSCCEKENSTGVTNAAQSTTSSSFTTSLATSSFASAGSVAFAVCVAGERMGVITVFATHHNHHAHSPFLGAARIEAGGGREVTYSSLTLW